MQILDAGGNVVTDDNVTLVTASIEKDDTIRMKVPVVEPTWNT